MDNVFKKARAAKLIIRSIEIKERAKILHCDRPLNPIRPGEGGGFRHFGVSFLVVAVRRIRYL